VRIVGHGNSQTAWNSLTEVDVLGRDGSSSEPQPPGDPGPAPEDPPAASGILTPEAITAKSHDGNVPGNVADGNLSTRWSAEGDGQWIEFDLGSAQVLDALDIAFYQGTKRTAYFDIEVSNDNVQWTRVLQATSSGKTDSKQRFDFADVTGRYVRIVGRGNSESQWNSLTEVDVLGRAVAPVAVAAAQTAVAPTVVVPAPSATATISPAPSQLAIASAARVWETVWSAQQSWTASAVSIARR
jgi:poly(beta-D-mannuronate) lyase